MNNDIDSIKIKPEEGYSIVKNPKYIINYDWKWYGFPDRKWVEVYLSIGSLMSLWYDYTFEVPIKNMPEYMKNYD